jgi:hypothetical protein
MKTVVEWLEEIAKQREPDKFDWQQAKEMYKQEIINAFDNFEIEKYENGKQYYEQTYEGNK